MSEIENLSTVVLLGEDANSKTTELTKFVIKYLQLHNNY